jgi:hypothetical protein
VGQALFSDVERDAGFGRPVAKTTRAAMNHEVATSSASSARPWPAPAPFWRALRLGDDLDSVVFLNSDRAALEGKRSPEGRQRR